MAGELSFFEIGVGDVARARAFYGELFGWKFEDFREGATIETPNLHGGIHGGDEGASPYVFFAVDDMDAALAKVRELGGRVEQEVGEGGEDGDSGFGRFIICADDQGSHFGLHEPPAGDPS